MTLSLKYYVNVASTSIRQKNLEKIFLVAILKVTDENSPGVGSGSVTVSQIHGSPDPDPYQYVTDP